MVERIYSCVDVRRRLLRPPEAFGIFTLNAVFFEIPIPIAHYLFSAIDLDWCAPSIAFPGFSGLRWAKSRRDIGL